MLFWKLPCSILMFLAMPVMANQQIFSYGQSGSYKDGCRQPLLHFSHEFSALSFSYLLQVWLSSQTGAVSSLKENPSAAFTGAHTLSSLSTVISICFWKVLLVTWKQVLLLIFKGEESLYTCLSR